MARNEQPTSAQASRAIDWPAVCTLLEKAFDRAILGYHPDQKSRENAILNLMTMSASLRDYAISSKEDLVPLWNDLRHNAQTVDLIMELTSELLMNSGYTIVEMAAVYADAVHNAMPRSVQNGKMVLFEDTIADDYFMDSLATRDDFFKILTINPWVLTMLLLKRSGKFNMFRVAAQNDGGE